MTDLRRRSRPARILALAVMAILWAGLVPATTTGATFTVSLSKVVDGLVSPTQVTNADDGTGRLFVVEQRGTIRVVKGGAIQSGYFLDIRSKVEDGGERGLLGLAFDPKFKTNHHFYVYYTRNGGDVVVSRFTTNSARTKASASSARPLLLIEHSAAGNHNGGGMAFGPSGYLFIGVGDGGGAGDPGNDAQQKRKNFLGKILRINVHGTGAGRFNRYSIPASNPFKGSKPGLGEIWAYGLRNPWRISFDRTSGHLYIADVGQDRYEEIDRETKTSAGGKNYGWSPMEGKHCYKASRCPLSGDTLPVAEYSHAGGNCAIAGGYVYRGPSQTALKGLYVFGDYCSGRIWTMPYTGSTITERLDSGLMITSFGESESGELYLVTASGGLYRVLAS
jgi:glucose/arabinose dehydrogenase